MYDRPTLGLREAMLGLTEALDAISPDENQVAIAVADHRGELLCYAAMDGVMEPSRTISIRKAFTSAWGRADSGPYARAVAEKVGVAPELLYGPRATSARGGAVIRRPSDGLLLGAVGISGGSSAARDEELSALAVSTILRAGGIR